MSEKLIVSWEEYNQTVEKLAIQIDESGYKPTILIGIMRGAAPMIDVLSRVFKLKCAYLAVESYSGKGVEDEQGDIVFSREMSSIAPNILVKKKDIKINKKNITDENKILLLINLDLHNKS